MLGGTKSPVFERPASVLEAFAAADWMKLDGKILPGSLGEFHQEAERQGSCRLLVYDYMSYCDPVCMYSQLCVRGECLTLPEPVSAGTLELRLSGDRTFTVEPSRTGQYYWVTEDFGSAEVSDVAVSAPGDVASGFDLQACLFEAPAPTEDWNELMAQREPGQDVVLSWSNPADAARIYLRMTTGVGTHGGISPVEIECEGRDVGSLTLPGAYLDRLYEGGWACGECGGNSLFRYHADQSGAGPDAVQLRAESEATFWFHPGVDR